MKKAIIYGTAVIAQEIYRDLKNDENYMIIAFVDYFPDNHGKEIDGINIISPDRINEYDYDIIIPASLTHYEIIRDELVTLHSVKENLIDVSFTSSLKTYSDKARETFLRYHSILVYEKKMQGSVAEGGVHKGIFSAKINRCFPDRKIYLFDTFEGFDERDVREEKQLGGYNYAAGYLGDTSDEAVLKMLPHKENAIIRKGYFPDTAEGIDDDFVFVNLDFDLYSPILAGLEFFYPKMVKGGVILVHDYFAQTFIGAPKAVDDFCAENNLSPMAIGDFFSCAIIKH